MLGSKGLLPPTDVNEKFRFELLRSKLLPQFCKHSESVDLLCKSLLPHVWRVPSSKALSCKHERLFDLLTLTPWYHFLSKCLLLFLFLCMFFGSICIFMHLFILFLCFYTIWWNNIHSVFTVLSFPIKICYNKCAAQRNPRIYFLAPTEAEMRKLWLLTALPLPV